MRKSFALVAIAAFATIGTLASWSTPSSATEVVVYKDPSCGCCDGWASYMRQNGYSVTVDQTSDVSAMSQRAGIPDSVRGCHLAYVGNYVISGMVPVGAVDKMLADRPQIVGIALPGMPSDAPGMNGSGPQPLVVYAVGAVGRSPAVYATE